MKKINRVLVLAAMIVAYFSYVSDFDVSQSNMPLKVSEYLKKDNVRIVDVINLEEDQDKNLLVHFKTADRFGVVLLHKGLNHKYQINCSHETQQMIEGVSFLINRQDYMLIYGRSDHEISHVTIRTPEGNMTEPVEDTDIFILQKRRSGEGLVELIHVYDYAYDPIRIEMPFYQLSTWRSVWVPLRSILIIVLCGLLGSVLQKRYNPVSEYTRVQMDGQRIRQDWFR
jgi:hypothetical protein